MTLRPGGEYPLIRRRQHRQRRRQAPAQAMQAQRTTFARSGSGGGGFYNPATPYMLFGKLITPAASGTSQKAQKALPPLKAA